MNREVHDDEFLRIQAAIDRKAAVDAEGYRAQAQGLKLSDNPYRNTTAEHWVWRNGYIQAFKDSH